MVGGWGWDLGFWLNPIRPANLDRVSETLSLFVDSTSFSLVMLCDSALPSCQIRGQIVKESEICFIEHYCLDYFRIQ